MGARQTVNFKLADFSRHRELVGRIFSVDLKRKINIIKKRNPRETPLFKLCIILKALPFRLRNIALKYLFRQLSQMGREPWKSFPGFSRRGRGNTDVVSCRIHKNNVKKKILVVVKKCIYLKYWCFRGRYSTVVPCLAVFRVIELWAFV